MRIRSIKPSCPKDEDLAELSFENRLFFVYLWMLADGEGRMEYRPKYIKAELLPYDDVDVIPMLAMLDKTGFIKIYEVAGREYIQIVNFKKHQRITGKEAEFKSEFPEHNGETTGKQLGSKRETASVQERERKKGKEEGKGVSGASDAPASLEVISGSVPNEKPPHVQFVDGWKKTYQAQVGEPFKQSKEHFIIADRLIKAYGLPAAVSKACTLALLCEKRSAWFTKGGWADYTLEKLSSQWNSIIPSAAPTTKEDEFLAELKKQEGFHAARTAVQS